MNDNDTLRAVSGRLNGARHNLDDINMGTSAGEIMGRARKRRAGRLLATAGTGGAALGIALALTLGGSSPAMPSAHLTDWTVKQGGGGEVTVTLHEAEDPAGLRAALAAAGVPAQVKFNASWCVKPGNSRQPIAWIGQSDLPGGIFTLLSHALPSGYEYAISVEHPIKNGWVIGIALIPLGSGPDACVVGAASEAAPGTPLSKYPSQR
ncbi:MAG: hypothetical protein ABSA93_01065 [Streptosporangiaceae bacterium]|jgi:hypothetical protein